MKTPLTYYGGKQQLVSTILPLIPEHRTYCEPFLGGGAIFFSKKPSENEVINDVNAELINFYEVIQRDYVSLEKEIQISLHSRSIHRQANVIYNNPDMFDKIKRAWAVWVTAAQSFGSMLGGTYGYDHTGQTSLKVMNKRNSFTLDYAIRLQKVDIECTDALRIIRSYDAPDAFFYCDPPYIGSDCGHYDGYSEEDYRQLLEHLSKIEGRFLLSSYPSDILKEFTKEHGWEQRELEMKMSVNSKSKNRKTTKIEVLTANYDLDMGQQELF